MSILVNSASLYLSDVPISKPVSAVQIGLIGEEFIINPDKEQSKLSKLELIVAGTEEAVLMIEGSAEFLGEEVMIKAIEFGHGEVRICCIMEILT